MSDKKQPKIRFKGFADDWEQRKLGEIVEINSGRDYKKLGRGKIPVFGTGGYMLSVNGKLSDRDSVGIGRKGSIDKPQFLSAPFWTVDTLFFMTPKNKNDAKFIFDLSQLIQWKKYDESTGVPSLSKSTISNIPITVTKEDEQNKVSTLFELVDKIIAANQHKLDELKQLKKLLMQKIFSQEWRFRGFTDPWEQRQLGDIFKKVNERNNGQFGKDKWISVANMYFQDIAKVQSNNIDTRTYVMRKGDIAFEGHPNKEHKFGRFVENDIGPGIISELFPIYRHKGRYDLNYWKIAIKIEKTMEPIFARSLTSSGNSSNKIDEHDFLRQSILVPSLDEQTTIGFIFAKMSDLIAANQQKLTQLKQLKKYLMQNMFV